MGWWNYQWNSWAQPVISDKNHSYTELSHKKSEYEDFPGGPVVGVSDIQKEEGDMVFSGTQTMS